MRVLLAEDDPMIAEIYRKKFESAGFYFAVASSGKEVLQKAKDDNFDIVLLDMVLPDISGLEVLQQIKKGGYNPDMKVIVFSNLSEKEYQDKALEFGADGYILKTYFNPNELVKEIERRHKTFNEEKKNRMRRSGKIKKIKKGKILFIEDEDVFIEMFGKKLEMEGYEVTYARNGAWGLKEVKSGDFDLIIMDMVMPAMGGKEIIEKMLDEENPKGVPIVVLTASATENELQAVEKMGVERIVLKTSIIPSDLANLVDQVLEKKK